MANQSTAKKQDKSVEKYSKAFNGHPPMFLMIDIKPLRKVKSK